MPYITEERREYLQREEPENAGELNYLFTLLCDNYLVDGLNYQRINDCIGALEGCKLELYRRIACPYEDEKMLYNGDVYEQEAGN